MFWDAILQRCRPGGLAADVIFSGQTFYEAQIPIVKREKHTPVPRAKPATTTPQK